MQGRNSEEAHAVAERRGEAERRVIERLGAATPSAHLFKAQLPRGNAAANSNHCALIKDLLLPSFLCIFFST